jgi:hypothetical protein
MQEIPTAEKMVTGEVVTVDHLIAYDNNGKSAPPCSGPGHSSQLKISSYGLSQLPGLQGIRSGRRCGRLPLLWGFSLGKAVFGPSQENAPCSLHRADGSTSLSKKIRPQRFHNSHEIRNDRHRPARRKTPLQPPWR